MIHKIIKCENKVHSKQGCYSCWHCKECGRMGCDNLLGFREGDTVEEVECDIEKDCIGD